MKTVLLMTDLTVTDTCSMQVELPIFYKYNLKPYPLITTYLSSDTSQKFLAFDLSFNLEAFINLYKTSPLNIDILKLGYLCNLKQTNLALSLKNIYKDKLIIYDPICADNFRLYKNIDLTLLDEFRLLIEDSIITPNLSEAIFLSSYEIKDNYTLLDVNNIINKLTLYNPKSIIITGVKINKYIYTVGFINNKIYYIKNKLLPYNFIGSGDRFNAYLIVSLAKHNNLVKALRFAVKKTYIALKRINKKGKSK